MTDIVDRETRSKMMARIPSKNTKPELLVRHGLFTRGYRYRLHGKYQDRKLIGSPDLVFAGRNAVVFVNGCFWHRHQGCKRAYAVKTDTDGKWSDKFRTNVQRDMKARKTLLGQGWRVALVWECATEQKMLEKTLDELEIFLTRNEAYTEIPPKS